MDEMTWVIFCYLLLMNGIGWIVTVHDKRMAQRGKWRVPEATLLLISALGGSPAMYLTMKTIRHKTRKKKFMIGIPVIIGIQLLCVGLIFYFVIGRTSLSCQKG